jgi:rhamnosyltransferase
LDRLFGPATKSRCPARPLPFGLLLMESSASVHTVFSPPIAQKICAVIVTYFPDLELSKRIERVVAQVPQAVIVDNGSSPSCIEQLNSIANTFSVHLILNPCNMGLASALNAGVRWAATCGFQWALTLDQDTTVAPDMIETLTALVDCYSDPERLAVVGSNYRDKVNGALFREAVGTTNGFPGREMPSVLTSGSLVSIDVFQVLGGFREDFFIDCVDHEYCLHARALGFHVVLTAKPVMEHGIGHLTGHRLLWRRVNTSNHSPERRYFTIRNMLILTREYIRKEPRWILYSLWGLTKSVILIWLFEKDRIPKLKYILRGLVDGALGRTGSFETVGSRIK